MIVLGMAAIVIGSNLTIDAATYIAEELGVSQLFDWIDDYCFWNIVAGVSDFNDSSLER